MNQFKVSYYFFKLNKNAKPIDKIYFELKKLAKTKCLGYIFLYTPFILLTRAVTFHKHK